MVDKCANTATNALQLFTRTIFLRQLGQIRINEIILGFLHFLKSNLLAAYIVWLLEAYRNYSDQFRRKVITGLLVLDTAFFEMLDPDLDSIRIAKDSACLQVIGQPAESLNQLASVPSLLHRNISWALTNKSMP